MCVAWGFISAKPQSLAMHIDRAHEASYRQATRISSLRASGYCLALLRPLVHKSIGILAFFFLLVQ